MLFPELSPSWDETLQAISRAANSENGRLYLDANILIHCYEMSAAASEQMLTAFESYAERMRVPIWAARETWEYLQNRQVRAPLKGIADKIKNQFELLRRETARYIDDDALVDTTSSEFLAELNAALEQVETHLNSVAAHRPKRDDTTARLLPFIENHRLTSDLDRIIAKVDATADFRARHDIPPGFADAPIYDLEDNDDEARPAQRRQRGKKKNANGDLIIWCEVLDDCARTECEHLIMVTRDVTKGDWVYRPARTLDPNNTLQQNKSGLTLAHPLLVDEAKRHCPSLQSVHIISIEILAQIWTQQRFDVQQLAAALQAEDLTPAGRDAQLREEESANPEDDSEYVAHFGGEDMIFEPDPGDEFDLLIADIADEGWKSQNQAVRQLEPGVTELSRSQRLQLGKSLVLAANQGALEPAEFLERLLANARLGKALRSDVVMGAIAGVFITDEGEPNKPRATLPVIEAIYAAASVSELTRACEAVLVRLQPIRRSYLALPGETEEQLDIELVTDKGVLMNAFVNDNALLEDAVPPSRLMPSAGREEKISLAELGDLLAEEFVVPASWLKIRTTSTESEVSIPENLGFIKCSTTKQN